MATSALTRLHQKQQRIHNTLNANAARQATLELTPPPAGKACEAIGFIEHTLSEALREVAALDGRLTSPDPREDVSLLIQQRAQAKRVAVALELLLRREGY